MIMKLVRKRGAPHVYLQWCLKVRGTGKDDYREVPSHLKNAVHDAMVSEQGEICAYTMKRIDRKTSHVEHLKPQSLCRSEGSGEDLSYSNMVACYPRDGMTHKCRYGAQRKGSWWDTKLFVSPLHPACEARFRFAADGRVAGASDAAKATIKALGLNEAGLVEDRRRAIAEFLYGSSGSNPLSKGAALRLSEQVCSQKSGVLAEYCVALKHALGEHARYVDKIARKKAFSRKDGR